MNFSDEYKNILAYEVDMESAAIERELISKILGEEYDAIRIAALADAIKSIAEKRNMTETFVKEIYYNISQPEDFSLNENSKF
tara:strand:- start:556 stop:804 length:249 start_codon:yes stop_codon:yes gene_type:complete